MRHVAVALAFLAMAVAALSGCAPLTARTARTASERAPAQPLARMTVVTPTADHDALAQLLHAQFAVDRNDLTTAASAYAKAMAVSDNPVVAERAAGLAIATHDTAAAKRAIQRWAALGASDAELAKARAKLALSSGDTHGAREQLEKLVTSGDDDAWRMFGRLLMGARDAAQAGQLLTTIATPERLPSDPAAWLAMSEMGEKLGQHAYARTLAKAAIERFHCADCYAWTAQLQAQVGDHKSARALYAKAVEKAPDDTRLRLGYAALLAQDGDNAAAARVLAKGPQDLDTYQARAAYAARAKDMAGLERVYRDLQHASDDVRAQGWYLLGQLAGSLDKPKQALEWFSRVPVGSEHRFDADLHSAFLLQQQGDVDQALALARQMQMDYAGNPEHLRKAIEIQAALYMAGKHYAKAISAYSRALEMAPDDTELLYGRGLAYAESGNIDAAVADLRHVLDIKPDDINALNALGFTLADANRSLDEARGLVARAHKARPHDPAITDSWGWVQYRLGHLDAAEEALQQAWNAGKDPEIGAHLAEVLWKQGEHRKARRILAAARKLAPHDATLRALQEKITP